MSRSTPQPLACPASSGACLLALLLCAASAAAPLAAQQTGEKEKQQTTKPKEKKKKSDPGSEAGAREITPRDAVSRVLRRFKTAFESPSESAVRELIETERFYDYPRFEEGVSVFLRSVGDIRVFTREVNVQVEGDKAVMIVDVEMVFSRKDAPATPETRTSQVTFDFQRTAQGWKITEINPRASFLP